MANLHGHRQITSVAMPPTDVSLTVSAELQFDNLLQQARSACSIDFESKWVVSELGLPPTPTVNKNGLEIIRNSGELNVNSTTLDLEANSQIRCFAKDFFKNVEARFDQTDKLQTSNSSSTNPNFTAISNPLTAHAKYGASSTT